MSDAEPKFPVFISLADKNVLIVGGGKIAARRAGVLLSFGAAVTVVSPEISDEMEKLAGHIIWKKESYSDLRENYTLIVAATNDRQVNRQVGKDAAKAGILVSVADCKEESTFWFPAVMRGGGLIAGMISENGDHSKVKKTAEKVRAYLEEL